jgi:CHAD domain-containing protein
MKTTRKLKVPQPVKARRPELTSDMSAIAAFKIIVATLLAQMQANRRGVIEGRDAEYLHQMRVVVRRLRALCGAYAKSLPRTALQPLTAELIWLARALGPARDADVFVTEIWPPLRAALSANPLLTALDGHWVAQQHTALAKARRALSARRYQRFTRSFERRLADDTWRADASAQQLAKLDDSVRSFACRVLERRDAKVRRHGHTLRRLDDAQLHKLRIQIKKLRYAADSFGTLFENADLHDRLAQLSRLQDVLGELNDIRVAEQHVAAAVIHRRGRAVSGLQAALVAWREARTAVLRRELRSAWRDYRHTAKFW